MTIEENARSILTLLCQLQPNDAGDTAAQGGAIQQRLGLPPDDINHAVAFLEQKGLVTTYRLVGTGTFTFYTVSPTVPGRSSIDPSLERDAQRVARLPGFQRPDPTTGDLSITAARIRDLTGMSVVRTNWTVELLKRAGHAAVVTAPGTAPFKFQSMTLTPTGRSYVNRLAEPVLSPVLRPQPARSLSAPARDLRIVNNDAARECARTDVETAHTRLAAMEGTELEKALVAALLAPQLQKILDSLDLASHDPLVLVSAKDDVHAASRVLRAVWPAFVRDRREAVAESLERAIASVNQALLAG